MGINNNCSDARFITGKGNLATKNLTAKVIMDGFSTKVSYNNNLDFPVTVVERNGMRQNFQPCRDPYNKVFTIHTEIYIPKESYEDVEKLLSNATESLSPELATIKEAYYNRAKTLTYNGVSLSFNHAITIDDLQNKSGNIYFVTKDVMVSLLPLLEAPGHPYATNTFDNTEIDGFDDIDALKGCSFNIQIVDNDQTIAPRFILIAKEIYKIIPYKNKEMENGIYVSTVVKNITGITKHSIRKVKYEFENCEETLGLFKTSEEALTNGNTKQLKQTEILNLEHNIQVLKQNSEIERIALQKELNLFKHESEIRERRLNAEIAAMKHTFEIREYAAKTNDNESLRKTKQTLLEHDIVRSNLNTNKTILESEAFVYELNAKSVDNQRNREWKEYENQLNANARLAEINQNIKLMEIKDFFSEREFKRKDSSSMIKSIPSILSIGSFFK